MPRVAIPGFEPDRARALLATVPAGLRRGQTIYALARHRAERRVDRVSIADPGWLDRQAALWPLLAPVMDRQRDDGSWAPLDRDRSGWFHTTPWVLVYLGYLGLNGTVHPPVVQAVRRFCSALTVDEPQTYACRYAMWLRSLLQLGFGHPLSACPELGEAVRAVCDTHLSWILHREQHCRGATRKGSSLCACGLVKELLFLSDFPVAWRTGEWEQAVAQARQGLLQRIDGPTHCSAQGRPWGELAYFRHVCPSWFEVIEALAKTGAGNDPRLQPVLQWIGARCVDGASWTCEYRAHRSVLLGGKRRTVSWLINLEPVGKPSVWLSISALEIDGALERTVDPA